MAKTITIELTDAQESAIGKFLQYQDTNDGDFESFLAKQIVINWINPKIESIIVDEEIAKIQDIIDQRKEQELAKLSSTEIKR